LDSTKVEEAGEASEANTFLSIDKFVFSKILVLESLYTFSARFYGI